MKFVIAPSSKTTVVSVSRIFGQNSSVENDATSAIEPPRESIPITGMVPPT